jgi:hypothetical protein
VQGNHLFSRVITRTVCSVANLGITKIAPLFRRWVFYAVADSLEVLGKYWEFFLEMPSRKQPQKVATFWDGRCIGEDSIVHKTSIPRRIPVFTSDKPARFSLETCYGPSAAAILQAEQQQGLERKQAGHAD